MMRRSFLISLGLAAMGVMTSSAAFAADPSILVAYFSATGTTKNVAKALASAVHGELYEITPAKAYTAADLDWHDKMSRSSIEMADEGSRPQIAGALPDMHKYGAVFIGYPIWWGIAPRILQTFVERCDLRGKTVIPFCTSGGSPFANSADLLKKAAPNSEWKAGRRLTPGARESDMLAWAKELGLVR